MIECMLDLIGFNGPLILFVSSSYFLYKNSNYVVIYILGFVLTSIINYILKGLFRHPRPTDNEQLFKLEETYRQIMTFEKYGMPSGHTQLVFYSTSFIYFSLKNIKLTTFYFVISLVTLYQRVHSQEHFLSQTIVGAFVGSILGYGFYKYARNHLQGPLKLKQDDNAPI